MLCDAMRHAAVGLAASACSRLDYVELFQRYVSRRSTARTRRHKTQNTHRYDLVCRICQFALMPSYMQWEEEVTLISVCDQRSTERLKACRTERCACLFGFVSAGCVANERTSERTNEQTNKQTNGASIAQFGSPQFSRSDCLKVLYPTVPRSTFRICIEPCAVISK